MDLQLQLELFVAGHGPSVDAYTALVRHVVDQLGGYTLVVTNVEVDPERAERAGVTGTPQLVRWWPGPTRRVLGVIEDADTLRHHLEAGALHLSSDVDGADDLWA